MFCAIRTADAIAKQSSKTWRTGNPKFDCHHYSGAEIRISPNYTCNALDLDTTFKTTGLINISNDILNVDRGIITATSPSMSTVTLKVEELPRSETNDPDLLQCLAALDSEDRSCDAALVDLRRALVYTASQEVQEELTSSLPLGNVVMLGEQPDTESKLQNPATVLATGL